MDEARLRDFAKQYTAAWCSRDPSRVASFFSPTGSLKVNDGAPAVGRDAITEVAQSFMTTFPDLTVIMDDVRGNDESAEYYWTLTGTNNGTARGGQRVRISGTERWTIGADGLIAASEGHFDAEDYRRQMAAE